MEKEDRRIIPKGKYCKGCLFSHYECDESSEENPLPHCEDVCSLYRGIILLGCTVCKGSRKCRDCLEEFGLGGAIVKIIKKEIRNGD